MSRRPLHGWCLASWMTLLASCSPSAPPPGYDGPVPSAHAQSLLVGLAGERLAIPALGEGEWTLGGFSVIPYAGTKGPVIVVTQSDQTRYLSVETDGDVGDLIRRVRGTPSAGLSAPLSRRYRELWE